MKKGPSPPGAAHASEQNDAFVSTNLITQWEIRRFSFLRRFFRKSSINHRNRVFNRFNNLPHMEGLAQETVEPT
jgi:hypothetical protein